MNLETELYHDLDLSDLKIFLQGFKEADLRKNLLDLFQKYQYYTNLTEWNKAVRICEALAIIGWGETDGFEAMHFKYFNGNPYTCFADYGDNERIQSAHWSKRKLGYTLEPGRVYRFKEPTEKAEKIQDIKTDIQSGIFSTQRNWLPVNPVKPKLFIQNALPELHFIRNKILELRAYLNTILSRHNYGQDLNYIYVWCFLSYEHTQFELDERVVKSSIPFGSGKSVVKTPKFIPGKFQKKTGIYRMEYFIPKEFGEQSEELQVEQLKQDILEMVEVASEKLKKNCPDFNFDQMKTDLKMNLTGWK